METRHRLETGSTVPEAEYTEAETQALRLVERWYSRLTWVPSALEWGDLRTEAWLAVRAARDTYDGSRGVAFRRYASHCALQHCRKYLRWHGKAWRSPFHLGAAEMEDMAGTSEDPLAAVEARIIVTRLLPLVEPRAREALERRQAGRPIPGIAADLGVSRATAERLLKQGLVELRRLARAGCSAIEETSPLRG